MNRIWYYNFIPEEESHEPGGKLDYDYSDFLNTSDETFQYGFLFKNPLSLIKLSLCDIKILNINNIPWGDFKNLKKLVLKKIDLKETGKHLKFLEQLSNLEELNLSSTPFNVFVGIKKTGLIYSPITKLKNLKILNLGSIGLYNNISFFNEFKENNLNELNLEGNGIEDISPLIVCTKLKKLYLNNNNLRDISVFETDSFSSLEIIDLNYNYIYDLNPLRKLKKLIEIKGVYCSDELLSILKDLKKIERLFIADKENKDQIKQIEKLGIEVEIYKTNILGISFKNEENIEWI